MAYEADKPRFDAMARREWQRTHGIKDRPVDKKEHYVKRCVGLPGEDLSIVNRQLVIDGEVVDSPPGLQFNYMVKLKREADLKVLKERFGLTDIDIQGQAPGGTYFMALRIGRGPHAGRAGPCGGGAAIRLTPPAAALWTCTPTPTSSISRAGTSTTMAPFTCRLQARRRP